MVLKEKMLQFIILIFFSFPILICKGNVQSLSPQYLRVCIAVSHPDKHCEPGVKWFSYNIKTTLGTENILIFPCFDFSFKSFTVLPNTNDKDKISFQISNWQTAVLMT